MVVELPFRSQFFFGFLFFLFHLISRPWFRGWLLLSWTRVWNARLHFGSRIWLCRHRRRRRFDACRRWRRLQRCGCWRCRWSCCIGYWKWLLNFFFFFQALVDRFFDEDWNLGPRRDPACTVDAGHWQCQLVADLKRNWFKENLLFRESVTLLKITLSKIIKYDRKVSEDVLMAWVFLKKTFYLTLLIQSTPKTMLVIQLYHFLELEVFCLKCFSPHGQWPFSLNHHQGQHNNV